jgi:hypothetical protein
MRLPTASLQWGLNSGAGSLLPGLPGISAGMQGGHVTLMPSLQHRVSSGIAGGSSDTAMLPLPGLQHGFSSSIAGASSNTAMLPLPGLQCGLSSSGTAGGSSDTAMLPLPGLQCGLSSSIAGGSSNTAMLPLPDLQQHVLSLAPAWAAADSSQPTPGTSMDQPGSVCRRQTRSSTRKLASSMEQMTGLPSSSPGAAVELGVDGDILQALMHLAGAAMQAGIPLDLAGPADAASPCPDGAQQRPSLPCSSPGSAEAAFDVDDIERLLLLANAALQPEEAEPAAAAAAEAGADEAAHAAAPAAAMLDITHEEPAVGPAVQHAAAGNAAGNAAPVSALATVQQFVATAGPEALCSLFDADQRALLIFIGQVLQQQGAAAEAE